MISDKKKARPILNWLGIVRYENNGNVTKKETTRTRTNKNVGILDKLIMSNML